jgi:hypothetical protein
MYSRIEANMHTLIGKKLVFLVGIPIALAGLLESFRNDQLDADPYSLWVDCRFQDWSDA